MRTFLSTTLGIMAFLVAFGLVSFVVGKMSDPIALNYSLDIINHTGKDAVVHVSGWPEAMLVKEKETRVFVVPDQDVNKAGEEREFTIEQGGAPEKLKGRVEYGGHTILDLTGDSCVVAVDRGRLYRPKGQSLKQGQSELVILRKYKHPSRLYPVRQFNATKAEAEFTVKYGIGAALPTKIRMSMRDKREFPEVVRLEPVPESVIDDDAKLQAYLLEHP